MNQPLQPVHKQSLFPPNLLIVLNNAEGKKGGFFSLYFISFIFLFSLSFEIDFSPLGIEKSSRKKDGRNSSSAKC